MRSADVPAAQIRELYVALASLAWLELGQYSPVGDRVFLDTLRMLINSLDHVGAGGLNPSCLFFFFNNPAPPEFSPLPLHDPLPICDDEPQAWRACRCHGAVPPPRHQRPVVAPAG